MDFWSQLGTILSSGAVLNGLGGGTLVVLFATDRILTKGQHVRAIAAMIKSHLEEVLNLKTSHESEVNALNTYHEALLAERDRAYTRLESTLATVTATLGLERERADLATQKLADSTIVTAGLAEHLLTSIDELKEPT